MTESESDRTPPPVLATAIMYWTFIEKHYPDMRCDWEGEKRSAEDILRIHRNWAFVDGGCELLERIDAEIKRLKEFEW